MPTDDHPRPDHLAQLLVKARADRADRADRASAHSRRSGWVVARYLRLLRHECAVALDARQALRAPGPARAPLQTGVRWTPAMKEA